MSQFLLLDAMTCPLPHATRTLPVAFFEAQEWLLWYYGPFFALIVALIHLIANF